MKSNSRVVEKYEGKAQLGVLKARKKPSTRAFRPPQDEETREIDGLLYQSRVKLPARLQSTRGRWLSAVSRIAQGSQALHERNTRKWYARYRRPRAEDDNEDNPSGSNLRTCCAESLYQLSCQEGSEQKLLDAGTVQKMIEFADTDRSDLPKYCGAILANITTDPAVHDEFVRRSGISAVLELCWAPIDQVKFHCATSLCRLSMNRKLAVQLFDCSAELELLAMLHIPRPDLQRLCIQTIVNIVSNGCDFNDRIYRGVSSHSKEGIIQVLRDLSEVAIFRKFVAEVIYILSITKHCASRAAAGGVADVLYSLSSSMQSTETELATLIVTSLSNFASVSNCLSFLSSNGVRTLFKWIEASEENSILKRCATTLANLASNPDALAHILDAKDLKKIIMKLYVIECASIQQDMRRFLTNVTFSKQGAMELVRLELLHLLDSTTAFVNVAQYPVCRQVLSQILASRPEIVFSPHDLQNILRIGTFRSCFNADQVVPILLEAPITSKVLKAVCSISSSIQDPIVATQLIQVVLEQAERYPYLGSLCIFSMAKNDLISCKERVETQLIDWLESPLTTVNTRYCCVGTIYHLCSTSEVILAALVNACVPRANIQILVSCSMTFSRISFDQNGRELLAKTPQFGYALNVLGRSGHLQCQYYSSIAACNVAALSNVWSSTELADFVVVALLRTNSSKAQDVYGKALFNLLIKPESRFEIAQNETLYGLTKLANTSSYQICIQVVFNLSFDKAFHSILLDLGILQSSAALVKQPVELKRLIAASFCNLSENTQIHARLVALDIGECIRSLCKRSDVEVRLSCAMLLRNLTSTGTYYESLLNARLFELLQKMVQSKNETLQQFAIQVLCNLTYHSDACPILHSLGILSDLTRILERNPTQGCIHLILNLSYDHSILSPIIQARVVQILAQSKKSLAKLITATLLNMLTRTSGHEATLIEEGIIHLCRSLVKRSSPAMLERITHHVTIVLSNLSQIPPVHAALVQGNIIVLVIEISECEKANDQTRRRVLHILRNLSASIKNFVEIGDEKLITSFLPVVTKLNALMIHDVELVAISYLNFCYSDPLRAEFIRLDGIQRLITLSQSGSDHMKQICAVVLHKLSVRKEAQLIDGVPELLMGVLESTDSYICHVHDLADRVDSLPGSLQPIIPLELEAKKICKLKYRQEQWSPYVVIDQRIDYSPELLTIPDDTIQQQDKPKHESQLNVSLLPSRFMPTDMKKREFFRIETMKPRHSLRSLESPNDLMDLQEENGPMFAVKMRKARRSIRRNPTLLPLITPSFQAGKTPELDDMDDD